MSNRNRAASLQRMEDAIVAGEMTITRQLVVIERLQRLNVSTKHAEEMLREMEAVLFQLSCDVAKWRPSSSLNASVISQTSSVAETLLAIWKIPPQASFYC